MLGKSAKLVGAWLAVTLLLYVVAYFAMPETPPSASLVTLLAGIAGLLVWGARAGWSVLRSKKTAKTKAVVVLGAALLLCMLNACERASAPAPAPPPTAAEPPPQPEVGSPLPRVTGIAVLLQRQTEEPGYGLYSYALLSHIPEQSELPRDRALLKALLEQPEAAQVGKYLPKARINITYLLLTSPAPNWEDLTLDQRVDYALSHYDYGRSAALLASLPQQTGPGPVITSTLAPLSVTAHPHPVLVQDLSTAQPLLMEAYVRQFVAQVAQDRFWEAQTLASFSLKLRNVLEVAATGLGMSQDAVKSWIQYLK
jgi:hypothetical protein